MNIKILASTLLFATGLSTAWSSKAAADTSIEILHGFNYNKDFNGDTERTILSFKTFQPWPFGTVFLYYDVTGPLTPPNAGVLPNQRGGFFGGTSVTVSVKKIGEKIAGKKWNWGALDDFSVRYELEQVSRFGSLNYYGVQFGLRIPYFDFVSTVAEIRDDLSLSGVDLQLGLAWQVTIPILKITDIVFDGFASWGVFGEGAGTFTGAPDKDGKFTQIPTRGRPFFITQPRLTFDLGKLVRFTDGRIYVGLEYQIAFNRYLQQGVSENVPQLLVHWKVQ